MRARHDAVLHPFICIVCSPVRPVTFVPELQKRSPGHPMDESRSRLELLEISALRAISDSFSTRALPNLCLNLGPATTQNLVVKFDGEFCGGVLAENAS